MLLPVNQRVTIIEEAIRDYNIQIKYTAECGWVVPLFQKGLCYYFLIVHRVDLDDIGILPPRDLRPVPIYWWPTAYQCNKYEIEDRVNALQVRLAHLESELARIKSSSDFDTNNNSNIEPA